MSAIRIIEIPEGSAPPDIRAAWVGTVIALADPPGEKDPDKYYVSGDSAVRELRTARKQEAAIYWGTVESPLVFLAFNKRECEYIP